MAEVVFDGVTKVFSDGTVAVESLDLTVEDGALSTTMKPTLAPIAVSTAARPTSCASTDSCGGS